MTEFEKIIHYDRIGDSDMYNCHEVGELVRCRDCKYYGVLDGMCTGTGVLRPSGTDYCSRGEKRC